VFLYTKRAPATYFMREPRIVRDEIIRKSHWGGWRLSHSGFFSEPFFS